MDTYEKGGIFQRHGVWLGILAIFVVFGFLLYKGWDQVLNNQIDEKVTITGYFSCLPLKEGVVLEEDACFLGLRSKEGEYYALDVSRVQDANTDIKAEDTIAVTGVVLPESAIENSTWSDHNIKAIIQVNTLLRTR